MRTISHGQTFDKEKVSFNLTRLKKGGINFEIVVDPDLAVAHREGKQVDVKDVLKSEEVFHDAKKGELAAESKMKEFFGTSNHLEVADEIIRHGEIQLSSEYRQRLREEKRKRILAMIHANAVDPRTHLPHPMTRIENAFEQARVHIDEFKKAEDQVQPVLAKLREVMPIRFEQAIIELVIPAQYAVKSYSMVNGMSSITRQEWQNDGSWKATVEMPAGMRDEFFDKLNQLTHGNIESKILDSKGS